MVLVFKTAHLREPSHYRPVALTCYLIKSMERTAISYPLQFAYRPGISVDNAVIYLQHQPLCHLEASGGTERIMFFYFSSVFNTINPLLLKRKIEEVGLNQELVAWTTYYLTNRPQCVRLQDCTLELVVCITGAPQQTVHSLYTSNFRHNSERCHLQKFSDDTAIFCYVT